MADELQELQENAEHGAHEPSLAPVTLTMAIFAVLVAVGFPARPSRPHRRTPAANQSHRSVGLLSGEGYPPAQLRSFSRRNVAFQAAGCGARRADEGQISKEVARYKKAAG